MFFLVRLLAPCKQMATGSGRRNKKVTLNRDQISGHLTRLSCPLDQQEKTGPGTHTGHRVPPPCVACQVGACLCHTDCPLCHTGCPLCHTGQPSVLSRCLVPGAWLSQPLFLGGLQNGSCGGFKSKDRFLRVLHIVAFPTDVCKCRADKV